MITRQFWVSGYDLWSFKPTLTAVKYDLMTINTVLVGKYYL